MTGPAPDESGMAALSGLVEAIDAAPAGARMVHGTFTVYKTDDAGLHVAYRLDGQDEDGHMPVPGRVIRLALAAASGRGPLGMLGRIL